MKPENHTPVSFPFLLLICLGLIVSTGSARARQFQRIGIKEGLSDSHVTWIARDHEGYTWFTTLNGIDRYDGYRFTRYSLKEFGLFYDSFSWCGEDGGRNLWIRSAGGDHYLYDREHDALTAEVGPVLQRLGIPSETVRMLTVDADRNLWADTGDTLYIHDFAEGKTVAYPAPQQLLSAAAAGPLRFAAFTNGEIWQLAPERKLLRDGLTGRIRLILDSRNRLWQYTTHMPGINVYDSGTGTWKDFPQIFPNNDYITAIADDRHGRIWLGSGSSGILTWTVDDRDPERITYNAADEFSLPSNHINNLFLDNDNILWVGTSKNGAAFVPMKQMRIEKTRLSEPEDVSSIAEDTDGRLWYGLDGKGLISEKDGVFTRFTKASGALASDVITALRRLPDGRMMLCTYGESIWYWDGRRSTPPSCTDPAFRKATEFSEDIRTDRHGNLWILTFDKGVVCLRPDGTWKHFTADNSELVSNSMTSMAVLKDGETLYVSTTECIYEIAAGRQSLRKISDFNQVHTLYADERDILWIGTTDGLHLIDRRKNGRLQSVSIADGLSNPYIQAICSDRKGNLWVSTNNGFTYIYIIDDPAENGVKLRCFPYFEQDGAGECQFSKGAIRCTDDGRILFGGNGEVVTVHPDTFVQTYEPKDLIFTNIRVSDRNMALQDIRQRGRIRMKHSDNLTVEVSAMDFPDRHKIRYEYSLDHSGKWTLISGNAIFLNRLPAGKHVLSVRRAGEPLSPQVQELFIRVRPPFSRSLPALLIYLGILLLIVFLAIQLARERNRKVIDLERHRMDENKLQFFTNISHDLRTPLTLLITPLNRLLNEYKGQPIEKELELMNRSAHTLMDEINQLLDFRTLDLSKSTYNPLYGDLGKFIGEICESYGGIFTDETVRLLTRLSGDPLMMDFDKEKILRIMNNLLSNAFKYSRPGGTVTVSVAREGADAVIRVADNGIGIRDEHKPHIFERFYQGRGSDNTFTGNGIGLHIVQEYVRMHGGTVSVSDNTPTGCIFTVRIPVRTTAQPTADPGEAPAATGKPRILLAEDNVSFRTYLAGCLSAQYDVVEADNGRTALELLGSSDFDLILSDVMMPEMDGLRLCREVRGDIRFSHIPIILLTAAQGTENTLKGLKEGADEYILKPFDYDFLNLKIERLLARSPKSRAVDGAETDENALSRPDLDFLSRAQEIIGRNLADNDLSVDVLSTEIGVSRSGLYKKMIALTGKSPIEYIRILRLRKGKEMLDNGETSISQIAWNVGFSPKQFSKYFKEEYGCLPSEYLHHIRR